MFILRCDEFIHFIILPQLVHMLHVCLKFSQEVNVKYVVCVFCVNAMVRQVISKLIESKLQTLYIVDA